MKWTHVKWLFIACLFAVDCLLGIQLLRQYNGQHTVSRAAVSDLCALLSDSGMEVSPNVIPSRMEKDDVYRYAYSGDACRDALSAMADSPVTGTYLLPNSTGTSLAFANGDSAVYYHNLYMTYQHGSAESWGVLIENYRTEPDNFPKVQGREAKAAAETASDFLSAMTDSSVQEGGARLRPRLKTVCKTPYETVFLCIFTEELIRTTGYFAAEVTGTELCMLVEGETVWYLAGTWIPFVPDEIYRTAKQSQLDILFSEKKRLTEEAEASGRSAACTVDTLERTYYMLWDSENHLYLRPAWRIVYSYPDGKLPADEIFCDAVTGDVVLFHPATRFASP